MRPTEKFTTTNGTEIEIYTYITGGEARELQMIFLEGVKIEMTGGEVGEQKTSAVSPIDASLAMKAQDKAIELLVLSVGGKKENILKEAQDLPKRDFDDVLLKLNEIQNGLDAEKKTN